MPNSAYFSQPTQSFDKKKTPLEGYIVGYAAIIKSLKLNIPLPYTISLVSFTNKRYQDHEWLILPSRYLPEDHLGIGEINSLYNHLVFSLKYEGINLLLFSQLVKHYSLEDLTKLVNIQPTGQYSRRIWFLVEWLLGKQLPNKADIHKKSYVSLINTKHQYAISGIKSPRHLIINNLPGSKDFCPLIKRTEKLDLYLTKDFSTHSHTFIKNIRKSILQRASAFLLLKDSRASFTIEGENPKNKRTALWGKEIGRAGTHSLNKTELLQLQYSVLENHKMVEMGFRKKGGFIGEHDRISGYPIPEHISAKGQDLDQLIEGWILTKQKLLNSDYDPVLSAASLAFGFVFIHPFEDGNGRIHRYLIHHILAQKEFSPQGIIFPVSASMLDHIDNYRKALKHYSHPLLKHIKWEETANHNVKVLNETIDFYRYFDATVQAEFLYECIEDTVNNIIPTEIDYLSKFDLFKQYLDKEFGIPDKTIALLTLFLEQNEGKLSKRAKENEFSKLTNEEINTIEVAYSNIFKNL